MFARMYHVTVLASLLLGCLVLAGGLWTSNAQAAKSTNVAVIDPQSVLEQSKAGKRALDTLKEYTATRRKLLTSDENELKELEKQLQEQDKTLSEEEKQEKQNKFRTKLQDYQQRAQQFQQELAAKQKELVDEYMKKIMAATKTVAEKNGYSLVLDKGSENTIQIVIYNTSAVDITNLVIKEFDKQNK